MTQSPHLDAAWRGDAPVTGPLPEVESASTLGTWPRLLNLGEDREKDLRMFIDSEIEAYFLERSDFLDDWKNWQTLYWATPEKKVRNFPFKRAANIVIPLAAIAVEAIHARLMNTIFSVEPFWSLRAKAKEWIESAKPVEQWLQSEVESSDSLDMYSFCNDALLEIYKLGTAVSKVGYEKLVKKSERSIGGIDEPYYAVVKNGAVVDRVPLASFIMRLAELDPQTAPLVGEEHEFTWSQLKKFAQSGRMKPEAIEKIKSHWIEARQSEFPGDAAEYKKHTEQLAHVEPMWYAVFKTFELWISFDVDGQDGWDEEVVVDYHKPSGTFLSVRYNWYDDLHRPYQIGNYFNVEGIWPGLGVCKQAEQFQAEATTIHRQRLDNATLANMGMVAIRKNSGYGPGEPIFPGKMWFLDDPSKDINPIKLNEVYPSSFANEQAVMTLWERRGGVNEVILGLPHEGTPATATSDVMRLAEGNKRFDLVLKNVRKWLSKVGVDVIVNYQIFGDQNVHWLVLGEDGVYVEKVLRMPSVLVRRGAVVDLTVTDSITNREIEQQQWLALFQVVTNHYDRVLQLAQVLGDPELFTQIAQRALAASDEAMRRLLETFQITDSDRFSLSEKTPDGNGQQTQTPRPLGSPPGAGGAIPAASTNGGGGAGSPRFTFS